MKGFQIRDIRDRITRDFRKSIDAEDVTINNVPQLVLITRDKGDEQIKKIKSLPEERFELGDIVYWNGTNYIIYKMDADRRIQSKGRMYECNITLRWKNQNGIIIERVGKAEDATKYGEGTEGTFRMRIGEFQLKVIVRLDSETVKIKRDDRFIIDVDPRYYDYQFPEFDTNASGNLIYGYSSSGNNQPYRVNREDDLESQLHGLTINDEGELGTFENGYVVNNVVPNVYKVTRRNVVTGTFPDVGYVELTLSEDQFVAGHDSVSEMIACKVSDIVKEGDNGHEMSDDENLDTSDGGWL